MELNSNHDRYQGTEKRMDEESKQRTYAGIIEEAAKNPAGMGNAI